MLSKIWGLGINIWSDWPEDGGQSGGGLSLSPGGGGQPETAESGAGDHPQHWEAQQGGAGRQSGDGPGEAGGGPARRDPHQHPQHPGGAHHQGGQPPVRGSLGRIHRSDLNKTLQLTRCGWTVLHVLIKSSQDKCFIFQNFSSQKFRRCWSEELSKHSENKCYWFVMSFFYVFSPDIAISVQD